MKLTYFLPPPNLRIGFFTVIGALIAISLCGAEFGSAPSITPQTAAPDRDCLVPGYDDHCERWVSVYDNPDGHSTSFRDPFIGLEEARAQAIGPYGKRVYVTGYSWDNATQSSQWATVAFDSSTGARQWVARHGGPGITSYAYDIAVSPDGRRVYVAGQQYRQQQGTFFSGGTTIAYDAATGRQLWVARHQEPFADASVEHLAISPDGSRVYVSGLDTAGGDFGRGDSRYVTLAYSASTGSQEWVAFHDNPQLDDTVYSMALDPSGVRVYVGGTGGIVAYDAATGGKLWGTTDQAHSLTVAPDGSRVFATRPRGSIDGDFDLVAYAPATGRVSWSVPLPHTLDSVLPLVADPAGARVYVATTQDVTRPNDPSQILDVVTRAFEARSGSLAWTTHYHDPRFSQSVQSPFGLTVSPNGKRLYLAASPFRDTPSERGAFDLSTVAYDAADGSQKWVGRYSASPEDFDVPTAGPFPAPRAIEVTPDGSKVIVAGSFNHHPFGRPNDLYPGNRGDYGILAYDTDVAPGVRALKAVSRKIHGAAGAFDIAGIECRSGGPNKRYQMVITFPSAVRFRSAAITAGTGSVASTSTNGAKATINLTGVANAQTITLTLFGVSDGVHTNDVSVALSVLVGDVSASSSVSSTRDLPLVQGQSGRAVTKANFREDVTANGFIGTADVSLVESKLGTVLP